MPYSNIHSARAQRQTTKPCKKILQTFTRYIEINSWKHPEIRALEPVLRGIGEACKQINRIVQRAQTDEFYGVALGPDGLPKEQNIQGEVQQKLDVVCNSIMLKHLCGCSTATIAAVASEEEENFRSCSEVMGDSNVDYNNSFNRGEYVAVFDPLDGSKNIDASLPVGTIFGIYKTAVPDTRPNVYTFLQKGSEMVAAGYCLYSATTILVLSLSSGVEGFTLDPDRGVFLHTHPDIRIPPVGPIYSFNDANFYYFPAPVRCYLNSLKQGINISRIKSNSRYIGSLVADVHNVLIHGGIFAYPGTRDHPEGKLRILYESNPMSMILEQAGGAGSTGIGRILDVIPEHIHMRIPTFLGSNENIYEIDQFHQYYDINDYDNK